MHATQTIYRELWEALLTYQGAALYHELLTPWLITNAEELGWPQGCAERVGQPIPPAEVMDLWQLYALSRVNELLLLPFQPHTDASAWSGPSLIMDEYTAFVKALGLTIASVQPFSPFHHEIVMVEQSDEPAQPISVLAVCWPSHAWQYAFLKGRRSSERRKEFHRQDRRRNVHSLLGTPPPVSPIPGSFTGMGQ